ncbi:MAG: hypothetical protein U1D30_12495 [Planctomycetota bacterium]
MATDLSSNTNAMVRESLLQILRQSNGPLAATQIKRLTKDLSKEQTAHLDADLEALLVAGEVHLWSTPTAKLKKYWTHVPADYFREKVFEVLSDRPCKEADLLRTLKEMGGPTDFPKESLQQALQAYIADGSVFPLGGLLFTRDPRVVVSDAVVEMLRSPAVLALSASEIAKGLGQRWGSNPSAKDLGPVLTELVREGKLFPHGKTKFGTERPPSPEENARRLGERLLAVLESQRQLGEDAYPPTIESLRNLAAIDGSMKSVLDLFAKSTLLREKIVGSNSKPEPGTWVVFREDVEKLIDHPPLVESAIRRARGAQSGLVSLDRVTQVMPAEIRTPFRLGLERSLAEDRLPDTVAWIQDKQSVKLLLLEDLRPKRLMTAASAARPRLPSSASVPPASLPRVNLSSGAVSDVPSSTWDDSFADFATAFEEAFRRLDDRKWNSVSLLELRREMSNYSRESFDEHLRTLRRQRRFSLSAAHERQGLSEEQRRAAILEAGVPLLNVSKEQP